MKPDAIRRVRESWRGIRGREEHLAAGFYARLFTLDPELRHLFAFSDLAALREKLVATLDLTVEYLDDPVGLAAQVASSGRRHALYGLGGREYRLGGEALLWALARESGESFTPDVQAAWAEAYTAIADLMMRAGA